MNETTIPLENQDFSEDVAETDSIIPDTDPFIQLWIHPGDFFAHHLEHLSAAFYNVSLVVFSIWSSIESLNRRIDQGTMNNIAKDWMVYWWAVMFWWVLGGAIYYLLGGWWYRKRVDFSWGKGDVYICRRLYLYSSLIWCIPLILTVIAKTLSLPNALPFEDIHWTDYLDLMVFGFVFYSIGVSYSGVKSIYAETCSSWKLRIWFLILPIAVYLWAIILVLSLS